MKLDLNALPASLAAHASAQLASGDYASYEDYIASLIRRDVEGERAHATALLQAEINASLTSGISEQSVDDILAEARARAAKP